MIATEFYDGQGLGNQLWVYATCRAIAGKLRLPHAILRPERFKGKSFLEIDCGCEGRPCSVFRERMFYDKELDYFASDFDKNVLDLKPFTQIHGFFQSEDYFFGDLALPGQYITVRPEFLEKRHVDDACCVLNIRGGEYKRHRNLILPEAYWQNAMRHIRDMFGIDRFVVVTDDRRYANALFPRLPVLHGGIAECYMALYQAKYLILSNTSFSYFPVKTGVEKKYVIAPMHWARFGNIYSRWAAPANLYRSWMWLDKGGALHAYEDCLQERIATRDFYRSQYHVSTSYSAVYRPGIKGRLPAWLRRAVKKGLSCFFPRRIG